jgi:uncharacterized membrane protein
MSTKEKHAGKFFSEREGEAIVEAIRQAELHTSGEIRVHLQDHCKADDILAHTAALFHQLKMDETQERNGVLVYLAVRDHRFAIYADEGINQRVPEHFWDEIVAEMQAHFQASAFVRGLTEGIQKIGVELRHYFPRQDDDENELPDDISYG